jgi:hypothetical protein
VQGAAQRRDECSTNGMAWLITFIVLSSIGALVQVNRLRFARALARDVASLGAAPRAGAHTDATELPAPVERYRQLAVGERSPVHRLVLEHGGTFTMRPTAKPSPIRGVQHFTADPPGFVWSGHVSLMPGVWVDVRDLSLGGVGGMRVLLDDTVRLVDARGAEIDQGAALRLLAELAWYPTAFFDTRFVRWEPIDASHAKVSLRIGQQDVSGVIEFGLDGLPARFSARRFYANGGLEPWLGEYRDYRRVSGLLVPFDVSVSWQLATGTYTYAHWLVDSVIFDGITAP